MLANEFTTPDGKPDTATAVAVHKKAAENGLLLLTCGPYNNIVRMIPALVLNDEHVEQALDLWRTSVSQVAG